MGGGKGGKTKITVLGNRDEINEMISFIFVEIPQPRKARENKILIFRCLDALLSDVSQSQQRAKIAS